MIEFTRVRVVFTDSTETVLQARSFGEAARRAFPPIGHGISHFLWEGPSRPHVTPTDPDPQLWIFEEGP
jgi:hypothetical protein